MAAFGGRLIADARWGIALEGAAGFVEKVEWPYGYAARRDSRLVLLNEDGEVVAAEGDLVSFGGGVGPDEVILACGRITVVEGQ